MAAVRNVNEEIAPAAARTRRVTDQAALDRTLDRSRRHGQAASRLGGNALIAVSMAGLHAAAVAAGRPLWRYLLGDGPCPAAAARDPDLRRRCPRRAPGRHPGLHGDAGRGVDLRGGARMDGRGVPAPPVRADGQGRPGDCRESPTRAATGRRSTTNEDALECLVRAIEDAGRSRPATTSPSRIDVAASELHEAGRYRFGLDGRAEIDSRCAQRAVDRLARPVPDSVD